MNTVEQSGTGFDLLFWYVLRKEKARQGKAAWPILNSSKSPDLSMITKYGW